MNYHGLWDPTINNPSRTQKNERNINTFNRVHNTTQHKQGRQKKHLQMITSHSTKRIPKKKHDISIFFIRTIIFVTFLIRDLVFFL